MGLASSGTPGSQGLAGAWPGLGPCLALAVAWEAVRGDKCVTKHHSRIRQAWAFPAEGPS